jgi:coenzyme F420 hydrogenase subunit beta
MNVFGPNELLADVQQKGLCIGCGACVNLCPYFKSYRGKTAMVFPCTLPEGRCHAFCPKTEVDLDEISERVHGKPYTSAPLGTYRKVMIARAGEKMGRGVFQAGGVASALITFALKTGMIDSAVLTDREGLVPVPRMAISPEEVLSCSLSKYMAAPTVSSLNQAAKEGKRRLGIVGTPCQMTAVAQMRANPTHREDFADPVALTVGLFCTWAVDTRNLMAFLSERLDISRIQKMDIPPPPAEIFVVETDEERLEIPLDEIRPLVPGGCRICPDMTSEWADVSVGVLEGRPDWNTLVIRTETGERLVKAAVKQGYLETAEPPPEALAHLEWAAANKRKRALAKTLEDGLLNTAEEGKRSAIRLKAKTVEKILK